METMDKLLSEPPEQRLVAHRGYPARFPENSLPGVKAALEAGARWVEVDVQLTRDAVPVASHDADLRRIAGREERIDALDWDGLLAVDFGEAKRLAARFPKTPPTRVADIAEAVATGGARLFLDIKEGPVARLGAKRVLLALDDTLALLGDRGVIISTEPEMLAAARASGLHTGLILKAVGDAQRAAAERMDPEYLFCNRKRLQTLWPGPWRWAVYVVDEAEAVRDWIERGVALVETDRIGELLGVGP